ncbi:hypothetical protein ACFY3G_14860 [Streptomyces phaeochromogenes]|uniref:hypothetical protein n=1 Tax=Streptomyces phaeochromogenes TaxID=1923 RepID=UPI0036AB8E31
MALNLGELVAGLRADDGQFTRSLSNAELAMRGLTRDVNGQLRDMHGRFVNDSQGMGRSLSYNLGQGARGAVRAFRAVGLAAMAMAAVSSVAAVGAAGALAVLPLIVIAGAAKILASNKEVAGAFSDLGKHVKTELTQLAQPLVKPFVQAAAQLRQIFDQIAPHIGAAFATVAPMIAPLVDGIGQFATGLMPGFVKAIQSAQPVIEALADGFGYLGAGLGGFFEGLAGGAGGAAAALGPFFQVIGSLLPVIGSLLGALATLGGPILAGVASAIVPLLSVVQQLADWLGVLVAKIPPGVLTAIGAGFVIVALGVKAYALAMTIASAATRAWAVAQAIFNAVMNANPIGLVIALVVALAAAVVIAYQKSETFRNIVNSVWSAVKAGITSAVNAIKGVLNWFGGLPGMMSKWWGSAKDAAVRQATSMVNWVKGLPGRVKSALGNLGTLLLGAGKALIRGFIDGVKGMFGSVKSTLGDLTSSLTSWKGPENVDKRLLTPAGRMVIAGFQRGIDAQIPALRGQLQGLTGLLPEMVLARDRFGADLTMSSLVNTPAPGQYGMGAGAAGAAPGYGSASQTPRVVILKGSGAAFDEAFIAQLRHVNQKLGGVLFQVF